MSDATSPNAHFLAGDTGGPSPGKARLGSSLFVSTQPAALVVILLVVAASGVGSRL
jgi:hypothetical protein